MVITSLLSPKNLASSFFITVIVLFVMVRFLPTYRFIDLKKTVLQTLLSTECLQIFTNRHLPINNDPHTVTDLLHQTENVR